MNLRIKWVEFENGGRGICELRRFDLGIVEPRFGNSGT